MFEFEAEFPEEEDLLQGEQLFFFVVTVAIRSVISGFEKSGLIIEMKGPDGHAGEFGQLFYRKWHCGGTLRADVRLESTGIFWGPSFQWASIEVGNGQDEHIGH